MIGDFLFQSLTDITALSLKYKYNQLENSLANGQNCIAFHHVILNKIFPDKPWIPILTSNVDPRTKRVKIDIMAVDLYHRYSNEAERAN